MGVVSQTMSLAFALKSDKKEGSTEIWTRIAGFKVQSANHYTIEPDDEDGIRTHAGRAQWISSPSP